MDRSHEAIHYDHQKAHVKEWPGITETGKPDMADVLEPKSFVASLEVVLGVHWQGEAFPLLPNGTLFVNYDKQLSQGLQSVAANLPPQRTEEGSPVAGYLRWWAA